MTPPVPADDMVGLALLGKTAMALGMVAACILLGGWLISRLGARQTGTREVVRVVGGTRLGQREKVMVVEVQGRWLVLGVTAQQVTCLSDLEAPADSPEVAGERLPRGFAQRLAEALSRAGEKRP